MIKLLALDLDGTVLNSQSEVSPITRSAICEATRAGVYVVLSTGRPYSGIPRNQFEGLGIQYCITTNGSGIYKYDTGECLYINAMPENFIIPILQKLLTYDIHLDAYIEGKAYTSLATASAGLKLNFPPNLLKYVLGTRIKVADLPEFIRDNHYDVQKITMNFYPTEDGTLKDRQAVVDYLHGIEGITCVSGGFNNLEFTKDDVSKGNSLRILADMLGLSIDETMAIGDTENDLSIIEAAGMGVAMGNATDDVKAIADCITGTNDEDGVAQAIYGYVIPS
ncbi:MAG: Cof-type HAD-IIB family hydrolase [Clostridiales bacterium]|nr:Cof-type HAD-IIB family hydrolase [Clostridiales bacterium]